MKRECPTVGPKDGSFTLEFKSAIAFGTAEEPPVGKRKQYDSQGEEMKWQRME
ncbi:MAG: hypothetical protein MJZ60_08985 [Bacteroidaceae bacterium]|nr:hypothetical protein [Bacteroidaceae bacterium]